MAAEKNTGAKNLGKMEGERDIWTLKKTEREKRTPWQYLLKEALIVQLGKLNPAWLKDSAKTVQLPWSDLWESTTPNEVFARIPKCYIGKQGMKMISESTAAVNISSPQVMLTGCHGEKPIMVLIGTRCASTHRELWCRFLFHFQHNWVCQLCLPAVVLKPALTA